MKTKVLELRDCMTFIPVLAINMNPTNEHGTYDEQRYLLRRAGYACDGEPIVMFSRLDGGSDVAYDPYHWQDRTFRVAHDYVANHWNDLVDGQVVDVEFILGEVDKPKESERTSSVF